MSDNTSIPNTAGHPLIGPTELQERGYLMEINRRILHPLGLALAVDREKVNADGSFPVQIWDYRDDPEGYLFADLSDEDSLRKHENVMHELFAKQQQRATVLVELGFLQHEGAVVQKVGTTLGGAS